MRPTTLERYSLLLTVVLGVVACTSEPVVAPPAGDAAKSDSAADTGSLSTDLGTTEAGQDVPTEAGNPITPDAGSQCLDRDGDGFFTTECLGRPVDCDDDNMLVNPGRSEVCDAMDLDEDCNPCTVAGASDGDRDMDTFTSARCANVFRGETPLCTGTMRLDGRIAGTDCEDGDPNIRPNQAEACNQRDDNCNGMVDEGFPTSNWYLDGDGDGRAARNAMAVVACAAPSPRHVLLNDDCDDEAAGTSPVATEICDTAMRDENCDGRRNEDCGCTPVGASRTCCSNRGTQTCAMTPMGSTWGACSVPSSPEVCDNVDNDCNGMVDEGWRVPCYPDRDGDTYAARGAVAESLCPPGMQRGVCPPGSTLRPPTPMIFDCDDRPPPERGASFFPGNADVCDGLDNNCNGMVDETVRMLSCGSGDCRRSTPDCIGGRAVNCQPGSPTPEVCDGRDNDCDGTPDNGVSRSCTGPGNCPNGTQYCTEGQFGACRGGNNQCPQVAGFSRNDLACSYRVDAGGNYSWGQGSSPDNSVVARFTVPNPLGGRAGLRIDVSFTVHQRRPGQDSACCANQSYDINNYASCDGGSQMVTINGAQFAGDARVYLSGCNPGGAVQVFKTTGGNTCCCGCVRSLDTVVFSGSIPAGIGTTTCIW